MAGNSIGFVKDDFKGIEKEVTNSKSYLYDKAQFDPYNPDRLFQKFGNYDIYDKMREDDQIKSVLGIKKNLVLSAGWDIDIHEDIPLHDEIRDSLLRWLHDDAEISFEQSLKEMLTNLDYGVSISEPVWMLHDGNVKLRYIKTRAPHSFHIYTDDFGNIRKIVQHTLNNGELIISPNKIIVFPHQMEYGNWYGKSDLASAYRPWWSKDIIIKFWNIYLEKWGAPTALGKYGKNTNQATKEKLDTVMKNIQTSTHILVPEDISIELIEAQKSGNAGFEVAIDKYNMMMARSMFAPDLVGIGGSETSGGSFSLGKKQFDIFYMIIEDIRRELSRLINRRIIKRLVDFNWTMGKMPYPEFKFKHINSDERVDMMKVWLDMVKGTSLKPNDGEINWARRIVGAPEGDIEFKSAPSPFGGGFGGKSPENEKKSQKPEEKDPKEVGKPEKKDDKDEKQMSLGRTPVMAEKRMDFKRVEREISQLENQYISRLSGAILNIKDSLIESIEKGSIINKKQLDKAESIKLRGVNSLRVAIKAMNRDAHSLGLRDSKELISVRNNIEITLEDVVDEVINKTPLSLRDEIADDILKSARLTIKDAIVSGLSIRDTVANLQKIFDPYDPVFNGSRLETIVRTNTMKVYNQTKQAYFNPFIASGDIKAFQYTALLDSRTSDFCASHDKKIYRADNGYATDIEPPNHFNCRSTMIPITSQEFQDKQIFGATTSENAQFFDEKGRFQESPTYKSEFERKGGGFFVRKKTNGVT